MVLINTLIVFLAVVRCACVEITPTDDSNSDIELVVGIDFGNSYSSIAAFVDGKVELLGEERTVVAFTDEEPVVGDAAAAQEPANPQRTFTGFKDLLGRSWADPIVQAYIKDKENSVVEKNDKPHFKVSVGGQDTQYTGEEMTALVLGALKRTAETRLGLRVHKAVATVPADFDDAQRAALNDAASLAGLKVVRVINDPAVAVIAYQLDESIGETNILVYDLGGRDLDVTVLTVDNGVIEVFSTQHEATFGGDDFDRRIADYFLGHHSVKAHLPSPDALHRLKMAVEMAKRHLSTNALAQIHVSNFSGGKEFTESLSRTHFEELNADLFNMILNPIQPALYNAEMKKEEIDEILLIGGASWIPKIREMISEHFRGKRNRSDVDPNQAVVIGAAKHARVIAENDGDDGLACSMDITALSLGIRVVGGFVAGMIGRDMVIPTRRSATFSTATDGQSAVTIQVFLGERARSRDNLLLGTLQLDAIRPAPRGVPRITVTLEVHVHHHLFVTAEDKESGHKTNVTIQDYMPLDIITADRMMDVQEFAEEDQRDKAKIQLELEYFEFDRINVIDEL